MPPTTIIKSDFFDISSASDCLKHVVLHIVSNTSSFFNCFLNNFIYFIHFSFGNVVCETTKPDLFESSGLLSNISFNDFTSSKIKTFLLKKLFIPITSGWLLFPEIKRKSFLSEFFSTIL